MSEKSDHRSASSGRGSVEEDGDVEDVEIRMINEGSCYLQSPAGSSQYASAVAGISNDAHGHLNNEDEDDKLTIHNTTAIALDKLDIHDLNKKLDIKPDPILDDIEVLT